MSCESDLEAAMNAANAAHDTEVDDAVADMLEAIANCNSTTCIRNAAETCKARIDAAKATWRAAVVAAIEAYANCVANSHSLALPYTD